MKKNPQQESSQVGGDSTNKIDNKRRLALLGTVGSASALAAWHTPIINAVITPVHAQTSNPAPPPPPPPSPSTRVFFGANVTAGALANLKHSPLDFIIPMANAGVMAARQYTVGIQENGDNLTINLFEVLEVSGFDQAEILYSGVVSVTGGGSLGVADNPCMLEASSIDATIVSVSNTEVVVNLTGRGESLTVPAGTGTVPTPMCQESPIPSYYIAGDSQLDSAYTVLAVASDNTAQEFTVDVLQILEQSQTQGFDQVQFNFTGTVNVANGGTLSAINPCTETGNITVSVVSVSSTELVLSFDNLEVQISLPDGTGAVGDAACVETPLPTEFSLLNLMVEELYDGKNFSPLDLIISKSHAGEAQQLTLSMTAIAEATPGMYSVTFQNQHRNFPARWSGTLSDDGTAGSLNVDISCLGIQAISAHITDVSLSGLDLTIDFAGGPYMFTLDPVGAMLPDIVCPQ